MFGFHCENLKSIKVQLTFDTVRHSHDRLQTDQLALNKVIKTVIEKKLKWTLLHTNTRLLYTEVDTAINVLLPSDL